MTIGKKLYMNFGIILTMVVVLFLVNLLAVQREHAAAQSCRASRHEICDRSIRPYGSADIAPSSLIGGF